MKSAVARIAINICRITSVVALMRSLDALLMAADDVSRTAGEKTDYDLVWALMSCPGLSPSPHIARENVQDGVVSRFDLTVSNDDFHAVLALTEPLYLHSCHILSFLPAVETMQQKLPQDAFLDLLPLSFTRSQALQVGERCGISPGTLDSLLKRMVDKRQLTKTGRGEYRFS